MDGNGDMSLAMLVYRRVMNQLANPWKSQSKAFLVLFWFYGSTQLKVKALTGPRNKSPAPVGKMESAASKKHATKHVHYCTLVFDTKNIEGNSAWAVVIWQLHIFMFTAIQSYASPHPQSTQSFERLCGQHYLKYSVVCQTQAHHSNWHFVWPPGFSLQHSEHTFIRKCAQIIRILQGYKVIRPQTRIWTIPRAPWLTFI